MWNTYTILLGKTSLKPGKQTEDNIKMILGKQAMRTKLLKFTCSDAILYGYIPIQSYRYCDICR